MSETIGIDESNHVTQSSLDYINKLIKDHKTDDLVVVLGNKKERHEKITFTLSCTPVRSSNRFYFSFVFSCEPEDGFTTMLADCMNFLASYQPWDSRFIYADTNLYRAKSRHLFPNKIPVGWMVYLPSVITQANTATAALLKPIHEGDNQKGTIVTSIPSIFDGTDINHIKIANNIEIELNDNNLLPSWTDL